MTTARTIQEASRKPRIVVVVASLSDLKMATRLRRPPDLFEVRLDAFSSEITSDEPMLHDLSAPLIITARHPGEGGMDNLPAARRRTLLAQFLPRAAYIDVDLRTAPHLHSILDAARDQKIKRIISVHRFDYAPSIKQLNQWFHDAQALDADVFKVVVRTDTAEQLQTLIEFFEQTRHRIPISAMGVGQLGRKSRTYFARQGSALNYVHLGTAHVEGQLSLTEMRRCLAT